MPSPNSLMRRCPSIGQAGRSGSTWMSCDFLEVERDVRLAAAIEWFRRGLISQGRAAEIAGIPRADFIDELAARKIDTMHVDFEELKREMGLD